MTILPIKPMTCNNSQDAPHFSFPYLISIFSRKNMGSNELKSLPFFVKVTYIYPMYLDFFSILEAFF